LHTACSIELQLAKRTESRQHVCRLVGLVDELSVRGHLRIARPELPAVDDDIGRPSIANRSGQSQSIHWTGHFDIGKNGVDVVAGFKDLDRLIGIERGDEV
jgi:hypothetical protein